MDWFKEFADRTERDAPIGRLTWYRLGGRARYLFRPRDEDELAAALRRANQESLPVRILGGGANVLVRDEGFDGVVVRLDSPAFKCVKIDGCRVDVGAGADLMQLVRRLSLIGLAGLETLAGVPGTVGGAVRMNAGGPQASFADVVREVRLMDQDGWIETWPLERLGFGYRCCGIGQRVVLSALLELKEDDPEIVGSRFKAHFAEKTAAQPLAEHSAGCVFKNPKGASAGQLIDRAGLKGIRRGQAEVSTRHANFIVADKGAKASDVMELIDLVRETVRRKCGIDLEVEIDIW